MNDLERFEELEAILSELQDISGDSIVLIEGNKDRKALNALGLNDVPTIEVQREGGPLRTAERVAGTGKKAIILTDWDDRGNRIAADLKHHLDSLCVNYDLRIRSRLRAVCIRDIKDVESLDSLYKRLSDQVANN